MQMLGSFSDGFFLLFAIATPLNQVQMFISPEADTKPFTLP